MSHDNDADAKAFIQDLEQRRGGTITYRTFSTFYADNAGKICDFGVFFYQVGDEFWFEDFEREPTFLGFRLRTRKDAPKYQKFESSFNPASVKSIRTVRKKAARSCALGFRDFSKLKTANLLSKAFSETVTEITLQDGRTMFFQFMDRTVSDKIEKTQGKA